MSSQAWYPTGSLQVVHDVEPRKKREKGDTKKIKPPSCNYTCVKGELNGTEGEVQVEHTLITLTHF